MNISLHTALYGGAGLPSVREHPNLKHKSLSNLKIKAMRSSSKIKASQNVQAGGALGPRSSREPREVDLAEEKQPLMPAL